VPGNALDSYPPLSQPPIYPGGETEALRRLREHMARKEWVAAFEKPKTPPNSLAPSTTVLSPYLKFGCISPRLFYQELKAVEAAAAKHSVPPTSLVGQLLWREFYYLCMHGTPNYARMQGNPICRQIPWGDNPEHLLAVSERLPFTPLQNCLFTPELHWQSRGKRRSSQGGVRTGNKRLGYASGRRAGPASRGLTR
jgi:deoxyribodipyrimidine photolyase